MFDDVFYPMYLEYPQRGRDFYGKYYKTVLKTLKKQYDGCYLMRYCKSKSGAYVYAVDMVYKGRMYHNGVGYNDKATALMSIIDAIRNDKIARIWERDKTFDKYYE